MSYETRSREIADALIAIEGVGFLTCCANHLQVRYQVAGLLRQSAVSILA
jgi:hypothetical protein